jgi:hypothetical protein
MAATDLRGARTHPVLRLVGLEDLIVAGWNAVGIPIVAATAAAPVLELGDTPSTLGGLIQLLSVIGAIVAVATRPSGAPAALDPDRVPGPPGALASDAAGVRLALLGPLSFSVALVAGSASGHLGLDLDGPLTGLAFLAFMAVAVFGDRLPVIDAGLRRALVLPFVLVSAGIFNGFAADLLRDVDLAELIAALTVDETGFGLFILTMLVGGLATFYAALVMAPRVIVEPESSAGCVAWPLRFALYLVSAVLGIGWLTALAS